MNRVSGDVRRSIWRRAVGRLAGLALAGATLLASRPAAAANVTVNTANIKGGSKDTKRQSTYLYYISYADCMNGLNQDPDDDWEINIPISVMPGHGSLSLWAAETANCATD